MATRIAIKTPRKRTHTMPDVGTPIVKRDRNGKIVAKCFVEKDGQIRYAGKRFRSLSGAATAAMHKMGNKTATINGWVFWGLQKPEITAKAA